MEEVDENRTGFVTVGKCASNTLWGGTKRVVSFITEKLVRLGHDVTLFASGDSVTAARLEAVYPKALRLISGCFNWEAPMTLQTEKTFGFSDESDLIHSHYQELLRTIASSFPFANEHQHESLDLIRVICLVWGLSGMTDCTMLENAFRKGPFIPIIIVLGLCPGIPAGHNVLLHSASRIPLRKL